MKNLLFLDLETTGLDTDICEVIEAAYSHIQYGRYNSVFKPHDKMIPCEISGITNIDNIDVATEDTFVDSHTCHMLKIFAKTEIAVTHNTDFDLAVLANHDINFEKSICTHKLAWALLPELANHKLGTLRAYFGIHHGNGTAHRAEYDVEILMQVFDKLVDLALSKEPDSDDINPIGYMLGLSDRAKLEYLNTWHFGKYKGENIDRDQHLNYIEWTLKNNTTLSKNFKKHLISLI